jgi:hypothetical protein
MPWNWHAHMEWLFERDQTNAARFAPDLRADPNVQNINRLHFVLCVGDTAGTGRARWADQLDLVGRAANFWPLAILSFGESLARLRPSRSRT